MKLKALMLVFLITFSFLSALTFYAVPSAKAVEELKLSHTDTGNLGWADMKEEHPSGAAYPKRSAQGQALTNDAGNFIVTVVSVYIKKSGSPTSDLVIHINDDVAGTVGTDACPSDGPWDSEVQSDVVAASSLSDSPDWVNFTFTDEFEMVDSTNYCVYLVINSSNVDNNDYVSMYCDMNAGHGGNRLGWQSSAWSSLGSYDDLFKIYGESAEGEVYPQYSSVGKTYPALAGDQPTFYANWSTASGSLAYWVFWSNNTGTPANASAVAFSGGSWSNKTDLTLNTTGDCWVQWKIYANNTDGNWNVTGVQTLYVFATASPVSRRVFGVTNAGARSSIYYNGSDEAIYVAYLNTTFADWQFQIRAYDLVASAWTSECNITKSPTNDQHWTPSISVLPDGHLIFFYYYDATNETLQFNYRVSTYDADDESNLGTLISSWGSERIISYGDQWSYPQPLRWDDRLVVFGREGAASDGNWSYTIYEDHVNAEFWVDGNNTEYTGWTVVGSQPYLDDTTASYIYTTSSSQVSQGAFTFPDMDVDCAPNMTGWSVSLKVYCSEREGIAKNIWVYLYNGSYYEMGTIASTGWASFDVTSTLPTVALLNSAKMYVKAYTQSGRINITKAYIAVNYTGFSADGIHLVTFEPSFSGCPYAIPSKSGDNILLGFSRYNYATGLDENVYFIYSSDKGDSWKYVNGTAISALPVDGDTCLIASSGGRTRVGSPILDESGKPVVPVSYTLGYVSWFDWKYKIAQYNVSLGSSGSWNFSDAVDEQGDKIFGSNHMNLGQDFFNCTFYGLPSFWASGNQTDYKVAKYVRYPNETHKFYTVWSDTVAPNGIKTALLPQSYIQDTPNAYEMVMLERWHGALGNLTVGANQQVMAITEAWGCKFTANISCTLIGISIYANVTAGFTSWKAAIYNSTFHLLGYTASGYLTTDALPERVDWLIANSFSSLPTITEGEDYWVFFKISASSAVRYFYNDPSSVVNQTCVVSTTFSEDWSSTLSPTTFYNRTITISAYPTYLIVRGVGVDEYVMAFSGTGTNTTIIDMPCLFFTYVQDGTGLSWANFRTNNTGAWVNTSYLELSGAQMWANFTETLNDTASLVVAWEIWANDTADNWGYTETQFLSLAVNMTIAIVETLAFSTSSLFAVERVFSLSQNPQFSSATSFLKESLFALTCSPNPISSLVLGGEGLFSLGEAFASLTEFVFSGVEKWFAIQPTFSFEGVLAILQERLYALTGTFQISSAISYAKEIAEVVVTTFDTVTPISEMVVGIEKLFTPSQTLELGSALVVFQEKLFGLTQTFITTTVIGFGKEAATIIVEVAETVPFSSSVAVFLEKMFLQSANLEPLSEAVFGKELWFALSQTLQPVASTVFYLEKMFVEQATTVIVSAVVAGLERVAIIVQVLETVVPLAEAFYTIAVMPSSSEYRFAIVAFVIAISALALVLYGRKAKKGEQT